MFVPHTEDDINKMLAFIKADKIDDLFDEIPKELLKDDVCKNISSSLNEMELMQLMERKSKQNSSKLNFIGAGAYEHYVPAAVETIMSRGEFLTAYTPYQAEASQGSLQLIYEYQTMIANLLEMEVSNASMYDGSTALAEAILMSFRLQKNKKNKKVLLPKNLHPYYIDVVKTIVLQQDFEISFLEFGDDGKINVSSLQDDATTLVIPQINFFGILEDTEELVKWAEERNIITIAVANPIACSLINPPGLWSNGVDIACGEGQPLGIPLMGGGPYFGFLCSKKKHVRQLPGRIVGRTVDLDNKEGFTLTLQAREQHIRRLKACSNICTNQGLLVVAATVYMSLMGPKGLYKVASKCNYNANLLKNELLKIKDVKIKFNSEFFHEFVIEVKNAEHILSNLSQQGINGGIDLGKFYPELKNNILVCVTETKTKEDINYFKEQFEKYVNF